MKRNCNLELRLVTPSASIMLDEESANKTQQLTIFYNGQITSCDATELQARAIISLASEKSPGTPAALLQLNSPVCGAATGLSMKKSLQRFLEKRKSRAQAMSPYALTRQYRFSVDEKIIDRYRCNSSNSNWNWLGPVVFETRIYYSVRGICGERKRINWECFLTGCSGSGETEKLLRSQIGRRLKDCWMPNLQIRTMIEQFVVFAKQTPRPTGPHGKLPVAVDVEVCTVQRDGEEMAAAVERAMKPAHLPPLRFYHTDMKGHPVLPAATRRDIVVLKLMSTVRVEDVEKGLSVMDLCGICSRKPIVGTQIISLLCGHAFHFHCVAEPLLEESNSCPTCNHQPAFHEHPPFDTYFKYDNVDYDPADPDRIVDGFGGFGGNYEDIAFWRHVPSTETFWSQLLDNLDG